MICSSILYWFYVHVAIYYNATDIPTILASYTLVESFQIKMNKDYITSWLSSSKQWFMMYWRDEINELHPLRWHHTLSLDTSSNPPPHKPHQPNLSYLTNLEKVHCSSIQPLVWTSQEKHGPEVPCLYPCSFPLMACLLASGWRIWWWVGSNMSTSGHIHCPTCVQHETKVNCKA